MDDFDPNDHGDFRFFRGLMVAACIVIVLIVASALVSGCAPTYTGPEIGKRTVVVEFTDPSTIKQIAGDRGARAVTQTSQTLGTQTIWIEPPRDPADLTFMCSFFHELLHMELGNWHDRPSSACAPRGHW